MSLASCLTATIRRIGGLSASVTPRRDAFEASVQRKGGLKASVGLVCSTDLGEYILWGRDGIIYNVYGDKIYLTRK